MTVAEQVQAEEELATKLDQYAGQWVAVKDHKVVDNAETLDGLLAQIEEVEIEAVFQVPADRNLACFY